MRTGRKRYIDSGIGIHAYRQEQRTGPDLHPRKAVGTTGTNPGYEIYITQGIHLPQRVRWNRQPATWRKWLRLLWLELPSMPLKSRFGQTSTVCTTTTARVVDKTSPVRQLHFEEAAELAYFGAKDSASRLVSSRLNMPTFRYVCWTPWNQLLRYLISNDTEKVKSRR